MADSNDIIINQCPECSQEVDVTLLSPFSKIECPHCQQAVRVRTRLGQYEIQSPLGEGGMSQVFAAHDVTLGRQVALKILHQELSLDAKLAEMFEREAQLTASINHPNVVKVYTVGQENGYFYIAMELVDAISVEQIIAEQGALPEEKVLRMAYDVVSGLKAAYQLNLIHRDIKPGNMLVTKDGTAKLVDFGLAVVQGGADENEDIWATPFYVPPEKLVREPDTYLGDIYALGATCYHAIAGQPPFVANTSSLEELIAIKSAGVDLKAVAPHATIGTVKLFEQMMAHSATARPGSYDELLQKIQARQNELGAVPQANAHSVKSSSKGLLVKSGVGVAVLAVAGVIFLKTRAGKDTDEYSSMFPNSERVISVEEREATIKMFKGRTAMVAGKLGEARSIFSDLEGNKNFSQPTNAWNTFNQGLVELLIGNEKAARPAFEALKSQTGFTEGQQNYEDFFDRIGAILSSPLPVLRADVRVSSDTFESVGLFAAGLKNWEQGQYEEANVFFKDFLRVESPSTDEWIEDLKPAVQKYQADLALLEGLPNPSQTMKKKVLESARDKLQAAEKQLKTKNSLRKLVKARIARAETFIKQIDSRGPAPAAATSTEWTAAEKAEGAKLQTLIDTIPDYKDTYLFSGALLKLEAYKATTPRGNALRQDLINGYKAAEKFIPGLAERLNSGSYSGKVKRKQGKDLDAKITSATAEIFIVDLGFGPNEVEIDEFSPVWLIEAAEQTAGAPSKQNLTNLKEAFWFANVCGITPSANRIAAKIISVDKTFKEEGQRFRKISFAKFASE